MRRSPQIMASEEYCITRRLVRADGMSTLTDHLILLTWTASSIDPSRAGVHTVTYSNGSVARGSWGGSGQGQGACRRRGEAVLRRSPSFGGSDVPGRPVDAAGRPDVVDGRVVRPSATVGFARGGVPVLGP